MTLLLMIVGLLTLLALRVPVSFALLIPCLIYVLLDPNQVWVSQFSKRSRASIVLLLAVPMFILLGNLANVSGVTDKLYDAAVAAIGHVKAALVMSMLPPALVFVDERAALADAAAMGRVQGASHGTTRL